MTCGRPLLHRLPSPHHSLPSLLYRLSSPHHSLPSPLYRLSSPHHSLPSLLYRLSSPPHSLPSPLYRLSSPPRSLPSPRHIGHLRQVRTRARGSLLLREHMPEPKRIALLMHSFGTVRARHLPCRAQAPAQPSRIFTRLTTKQQCLWLTGINSWLSLKQLCPAEA